MNYDTPKPSECERRTDDALASSASRGSRPALAELFRRHADTVYGAALRVLGSTSDAEDVLQDVFVGLPRALQRYDARGRFPGFIHTVATRAALMKLRGERRRPWTVLPPDMPGQGSRPDATVERVDLGRALSDMPEGLRRAFLLREIDGFGHEEIAALLGISAGASRARVHRAWAWLRRRLPKEEEA